MMAGENGERRVTYKTLFGLASGLLGSIALILWFVMSDRVKTAEANIDKMQERKLDKEDFYRAMNDIRAQYQSIDSAIREHERRAARRSGD